MGILRRSMYDGYALASIVLNALLDVLLVTDLDDLCMTGLQSTLRKWHWTAMIKLLREERGEQCRVGLHLYSTD